MASRADKNKNRARRQEKKQRQKHARAVKHDRVCGLCGNTKNLIQTECCGHWICDDEGDYVLFSYARNSCHRNHRRMTLCGIHAAEGHEGRWQDCPQCRDSFPTEMYVWYGTNEYNFEVLPNPPAYEPTLCDRCGTVISLADGGYSTLGDEYFCEECTQARMDERSGRSDDPAEPARLRLASQDEQADASLPDEPDECRLGDLDELRLEVPPENHDRFETLVALLDPFCDTHLNDEYKNLCREMAAEACMDDFLAERGAPQSWAAGIVYAIGKVNFLHDDRQTPNMTSRQIAEAFGISVATMQAKARILDHELDLAPFDPNWTLPSRMDRNPLAWMFKVNGAIVDIRMAPREVQAMAYAQGLIPYIPADRKPSAP